MKYIPLLLLLTALGCRSQRHYSDPVAVFMNKEEGHVKRWAAIKQSEQEASSDPRRIAALKRLIYETGYPAEYSNYAIDELIRLNEADARAFLSKTVVLIKDWDTLEHLFNTAVKRGWKDYVPALVRNYAQTTPVYKDGDRPERAAIAALRPDKSVDEVILEVFTSDTLDPTQRAAAWQLIYRLNPDHARLVALLSKLDASAGSRDATIADLRAAAVDLKIVPNNVETTTWLRMIRTEPYAGYWKAAAAAVAAAGPEQQINLQLRHLPILIYYHRTNPALLSRSRDSLLSEISTYISSQEHHVKGPTYDGPMEDYPQEFRAWQSKLAWGDLMTMRMVSQIMKDPRITSEWFAQGDADAKDKSTEYGGLIRLDETGKPLVMIYKPMIRKHDLIYYPPKELVTDAYTALAHFHFHAQEYKNRQYAGPGLGDMDRTAKRQQFNGLVLTFIDQNKINVDYYGYPDVVVDMGIIRR